MKKISSRILPLLIVMVMILSMGASAFAIDGSVPPTVLKASMRNANELASPTDPAERALRGNYLPYTGYFEESFTTGGAAGRKARFYIPEGAYVRNYFLTLALPSGTDVEEFLINSGWIDVANAERMCLMILMPKDGGAWGSYDQERAYFEYMLDRAGSGRRWYSVYSTFYLAGYGDGGDILQQFAVENPLFVISQAYFDSAIDPATLAAAGEFYYIPDPQNAQRAATSATPVEVTFECVKKKDVPVPTYLFGSSTSQGVIDYWKANNECDASFTAGAGPLGSDLFFQNKTNTKAIATAYSNVVSRVGVLKSKVSYVDKAVTQAVYDALAVYTRYTNTSAWSNALGFRPDHEALDIEIIDIWRVEADGRNVKRQYITYVPEKVKDKTLYPNGAPVVYAFGGGGNNAFQYFESSQYVELADTYGFSVIMPSEHTSPNGVTTGWYTNEYDYQFVLDVMGRVNAKYGQYFDQNRIFAMGHSQGGGLTNYLSERDPDLFTAYAIMAGLTRNFAAGAPRVPMYAIYGEYDSISYLTNRVQWLKRSNFKDEDAIITDPWDLPSRYGNPIEYLIYPDSAKYPGDKFLTYTWYDENGIPMFNDTTAYGREHNNTVPDARRIWTEWFSKWDRDEAGNRVYNHTITLTTEAQNVAKGDYVDLDTTFAQQMSSNTATLTYSFDGDKFDFVDFKPASGVMLLNTDATQKGAVKVTVMSMNYDLEDLGVFTLQAKADATFLEDYQTVSLAATYVLKDEAGNKSMLMANAAALFTTWNSAESLVQAFVTRFYQLFFDREPDQGGLDYWTNALLSKEKTGAEVSAFFVDSPEFRALNVNDATYLDMMYRAFFDRDPDAGGKAYWQDYLDNGMSRYWVLYNFVNSNEFQTICNDYFIERGSLALTQPADLYPKITAFVTRFYKLTLERNPDREGLNYWVKGLSEGTRTGAILANDFIHSPEFIARNTTNSQFVTIMYQTFFDREPESAGYDYWMNELLSGSKTRDQVLGGFVYSAEFQGICDDYGIVRGNLP